MEINKDEGIKKATEDQVPATDDILQLDHNLLTPTEIKAFKMIELARIQNMYLTSENILLKEHIIALKGIIRKLEDLLHSMYDYHHHLHLLHQPRRYNNMGMGTPLGNRQAWGRCPGIVSPSHSYFSRFS